MKLKNIVNEDFSMAIRALMSSPIAAKTAFKLKGVYKVAVEQQKLFAETKEEAIKKYAALKEDGSVKADAAGVVEFKDEESKQAALKEIGDLLEQEVEFPTLPLADFGDTKLEPRSLLALDGVIVE